MQVEQYSHSACDLIIMSAICSKFSMALFTAEMTRALFTSWSLSRTLSIRPLLAGKSYRPHSCSNSPFAQAEFVSEMRR